MELYEIGLNQSSFFLILLRVLNRTLLSSSLMRSSKKKILNMFMEKIQSQIGANLQ